MFRGTLSEAKKARAALLVEVGKGRHTGTGATVDHLFEEWIVELQRKGCSPNTIHGYKKSYERNIRATLGSKAVSKVTTKTLTDLYGAHQARGLAPATVYQIHACLSSMLTQACRWGGATRTRRSGPTLRRSPRSPVVPTRAGHDPSVAAKHYTGNVEEVDRALASAVASLLLRTRPGLNWETGADPARQHPAR